MKAERGKLSAHQQDILELLGCVERTVTASGTANVVGEVLVNAIKRKQETR
jgi:hypothetical protein